jgi:hypothetical protein
VEIHLQEPRSLIPSGRPYGTAQNPQLGTESTGKLHVLASSLSLPKMNNLTKNLSTLSELLGAQMSSQDFLIRFRFFSSEIRD